MGTILLIIMKRNNKNLKTNKIKVFFLLLLICSLWTSSLKTKEPTPEEMKNFELATEARLIELIDLGINPEIALIAAMFGVNKEIFQRWSKVSDDIQELLEFKLLGVTIDVAIEWRKLGFVADEAHEWKKIDLEQLIGEWWYKIGLNS